MPNLQPRYLAAVLALVQAILLAHTAWDKSDTSDEPAYLAAGALLWAHRDYAFNKEAPVLPKWGFALAMRLVGAPLADTPPEWHRSATHVLWSRRPPRMRLFLFAARAATILVTVAAGLLLWLTGRRFGEGVGLLAQALWCLSPTVLAQGSLATLDAWLAATLAATLWAAVRFLESPSPRRAAGTGAAFGLALACKVPALLALPVLMVVGVIGIRRAASARPWRAALMCGLAFGGASFFTLWALYGFTIGWVGTQDLASRYGIQAASVGPLPFPHWIEGLLQQWALGAKGHLTYLFGEVRRDGWWWFYLAALALKTTIASQLLVVLRLAAWVKRPPSRLALGVDVLLLGFPLLLVAMLSAGKTQTGIRYLLPAFPLMVLWLARALPDLKSSFGRAGPWLAAAAVGVGAIESLAVHPHHLMFFNRWAGGPEGGPRYLIVGDDWGQDQRRLGEWIAERQLPGVFYTLYSGMPQKWGIQYRQAPCTPRRGTFALHAVEVHRPRRTDPGCLDWLTVEPPDERLGYSIYIYFVNKERLERLVARRDSPNPFWRSGAKSSSFQGSSKQLGVHEDRVDERARPGQRSSWPS